VLAGWPRLEVLERDEQSLTRILDGLDALGHSPEPPVDLIFHGAPAVPVTNSPSPSGATQNSNSTAVRPEPEPRATQTRLLPSGDCDSATR
jgi:hypothetical protein